MTQVQQEIISQIIHEIPKKQLLAKSQYILDELTKNKQINIILNDVLQEIINADIQIENIRIFSRFINGENIEISMYQYFDLCKLSDIFICEELKQFLQKTKFMHSDDIDFIIAKIIDQSRIKNPDILSYDSISPNLELILSKKN